MPHITEQRVDQASNIFRKHISLLCECDREMIIDVVIAYVKKYDVNEKTLLSWTLRLDVLEQAFGRITRPQPNVVG